MIEDKLNFLVKRDLWLAAEEEPFKILNWTTTKPKFDNGFIKENSALIFDQMIEDTLEFIMVLPGSKHEEWYAEFSQEEIEYLTKEGSLELIKITDIAEVDITSVSESQGPILIRDSVLFIFNKEAILPKDLYIVMGRKENMQSQGKLVPGEKISLRELLDNYSTAIGQNRILR